MSRRSKVAMLVMAAFVAFIEGPLNPFWIWNALPIGLSYLVLRRMFDDRRLHAPAVVFAAVTCFVVVSVHIAWMFDPGGVATDPQTSTRVFMLTPVFALLIGAAGWGVAYQIGGTGASAGNRSGDESRDRGGG
ncbi:MAG: hypothetical protein PVH91_08065 [Pseudomonadales bacterium]